MGLAVEHCGGEIRAGEELRQGSRVVAREKCWVPIRDMYVNEHPAIALLTDLRHHCADRLLVPPNSRFWLKVPYAAQTLMTNEIVAYAK